jgi:amidase
MQSVCASDPAPLVDLLRADIAAQRAAMDRGHLGSADLVDGYLERIARLDRDGPRINAVIELDPDAPTAARELDAERAAGRVRGPLHGIPVLVKDNIAVAGGTSTTAGSLALDGVPAARDAPLVAHLRDAGAVILGKTNLSEWANIRSSRSSSGWSARGGLTRNPHALDRSTSGSSSGSGAAIAASLATVAIGTETDGSIVSPSSINGIVGLKPTVGLVSREGVIPISHSQDTAGPMTRTVADAALVLQAFADLARVPEDLSPGRPGTVPDYARHLDRDALGGARLGVARSMFATDPAVVALAERALADLAAAGAELVDVTLPAEAEYEEAEVLVMLVELAAGLPDYLRDYAPDAAVHDLAEVVAFNRRHADRELARFGQDLFERALELGGLDDPEYLAAHAHSRGIARAGLDAAFGEHGLDAIVAPTNGPAWLIDFISGDHHPTSFSTPAAVAGYPHLTVPAGFVAGLPVGLSFVGPAWSEPQLLALGYAYEQTTGHRRDPAFSSSVTDLDGPR